MSRVMSPSERIIPFSGCLLLKHAVSPDNVISPWEITVLCGAEMTFNLNNVKSCWLLKGWSKFTVGMVVGYHKHSGVSSVNLSPKKAK